MATCRKEVEIEFGDDGDGSQKVIDATITAEGMHDPHYGSDTDGHRGEAVWIVESHSVEFDEDGLTQKEIDEIKEKAEEIALEEAWDFDSAKDDEEADSFVERDED